jgi:DNA-binding LacI/PurR family transcriptional regulator
VKALNTQKPQGVDARTKTQELCLRLGAMAQRLGAGAKLPTVLDLCRELGVSKITVARALDILEEQGVLVRRHGVGIFVSPSVEPRPTFKIILLCDASLLHKADHSPFWRALIEKIHQRSAQANEFLTLHFVSENQNNDLWRGPILQGFHNGQFDGVLGVHLLRDVTEWLEQAGLPAVHYASYGAFFVQVATDDMVCQGVRALWNRGCRRVGIWSAVAPYTTLTHEYLTEKQPVFESLERQGTPVEYSNVENNTDLLKNPQRMTTKTQSEQGFETAMKVFSRPKSRWPDGVFVAEDSTCRGALTAFQKLGIEVGRDVLVASHINKGSDVLLGHEDDLILVEVDPGEIVQAMFDMLEALMRGETPAQAYVPVYARLRP